MQSFLNITVESNDNVKIKKVQSMAELSFIVGEFRPLPE